MTIREKIEWWYNWMGWKGVLICLFGFGKKGKSDVKKNIKYDL